MLKRVVIWCALSCILSPILLGSLTAAERALWLLQHGNAEAISWKVPQVLLVASAISFLAALCWVFPTIAVWSTAVRARPSIDHSWLASLLGPFCLTLLFGASMLFVAPDLIPDTEVAWLLPLALFVIWPRVVVRALRPGKLRAA